jgi:hypothetical protein
MAASDTPETTGGINCFIRLIHAHVQLLKPLQFLQKISRVSAGTATADLVANLKLDMCEMNQATTNPKQMKMKIRIALKSFESSAFVVSVLLLPEHVASARKPVRRVRYTSYMSLGLQARKASANCGLPRVAIS